MNHIFWIPIIVSVLSLIWNYIQQKSIEKIKSENQKNNLIHRIQFEKEFEIYSDLWAKLVDLRNHTRDLRPQLDFIDPNESEKERNIKRFEKLNNSFIVCVNSFEKNKPFYPKIVYDNIAEALKITKREAFGFQRGDKNSDEYWDESEKNINRIIDLTNNICETIRKRIGIVKVQV